MKINQVEELVGITKKNIRFYESQGLLSPGRDPENGYREYSLQDVEQLQRIKLLRKLDVPCDQIRRVIGNELSLQECVRAQEQILKKRSDDLSEMREICAELAESDTDLNSLEAAGWLEHMKKLEKGGVQFMDARKTDIRQRKWGSWLSAAAAILFMAAMIGLILWGNRVDPVPTGVLVIILLIPVSIIAGIVIALYQRMKELKGDELDEARKY